MRFSVVASLSAVGFGLFASIAIVACSGEVDSVIAPRDGFTNQDAPGGDLSGPQPDMARPWSDVSVPAITGNFWSVWNSGNGTVVAVGDGAMIYKSKANGPFALDTSMKPTTKPNLLSINGLLPGPPTKTLFTIGQQGSVWSYTGDLSAASGMFAAETTNVTKGLYGSWIAADGTAWVVGEGTAIKRVGTTWTALTGIDATSAAYNLWGTPTTGGGYLLYAVGAGGKIWRSDGGNFVSETSGTTSALYGVWGSGPTDIYAVGDIGTLLHSTGNGMWTVQNSGVSVPLEGIGGVNANEIYVVGDTSTMLAKYDSTSSVWYAEALPMSAANRAVNSVFATSTAVYAVGNAGLIIKK